MAMLISALPQTSLTASASHTELTEELPSVSVQPDESAPESVRLEAEPERPKKATTSGDQRTLAMELDGVAVSFSEGEAYPWQYSDSNALGTAALISSNQSIGNSTSETTLTFDSDYQSILSFHYAVSSESNFDKFTLCVDGTPVADAISSSTSGELNTYAYAAVVGGGSHTVSLSYSKDGSVDKGEDAAYIYNIRAEVFQIADSGTCGDSVNWFLSTKGTLYINGTGAMYDYSWADTPWYADRSSIKSVAIADGVTSIGAYAFLDCSGLTSATIPNSVTSIGEFTFSYCRSLTSITIPDSVTIIGNYAFYWCNSLTNVTFGDGVTTIGNYAFHNCESLTSITIPTSVTSIGDHAFSWCMSLMNIAIPDRVVSIGSSAFQYCRCLTSITLPDGIMRICDSTFKDCYSLMGITIPENVKSIGNWSFESCDLLTSITIPNGVMGVGDYAFRSCSSLTSVTIPDSVTSIGDYAFYSAPPWRAF